MSEQVGSEMKFPPIPKDMDDQSAYDHVCACLAIQGRRSTSDNTCLYRGPNGLRCAVGHCIPDDEYLSSFDSPSTMSYVYGEVPSLKNVSWGLLDRLQAAHDFAEFASLMREKFVTAANMYGLTPGAEEAIKEWVR